MNCKNFVILTSLTIGDRKLASLKMHNRFESGARQERELMPDPDMYLPLTFEIKYHVVSC